MKDEKAIAEQKQRKGVMILLLMGIVCVALLSAALVVVMLNEREKESNERVSLSPPTNEEFEDFDGAA